jgi:hypothetical protein
MNLLTTSSYSKTIKVEINQIFVFSVFSQVKATYIDKKGETPAGLEPASPAIAAYLFGNTMKVI